jgi:hypothetical protein
MSPMTDQLGARLKVENKRQQSYRKAGTYVPQAAFYPLPQKSSMTLQQLLESVNSNLERGLTSQEVSERTATVASTTLQEVKGTALDSALRTKVYTRPSQPKPLFTPNPDPAQQWYGESGARSQDPSQSRKP